MKKEMLINVLQPEECRIAIIEDGVLEELYVERTSHESYVGNIYKGRIVNIEPSIQAAFVDFGVGRNGFLHVSDVEPAYYSHLEPRRDERNGPRGGRDRGGRDRDRGGRRDRGPDDRRRREPRTPIDLETDEPAEHRFAEEGLSLSELSIVHEEHLTIESAALTPPDELDAEDKPIAGLLESAEAEESEKTDEGPQKGRRRSRGRSRRGRTEGESTETKGPSSKTDPESRSGSSDHVRGEDLPPTRLMDSAEHRTEEGDENKHQIEITDDELSFSMARREEEHKTRSERAMHSDVAFSVNAEEESSGYHEPRHLREPESEEEPSQEQERRRERPLSVEAEEDDLDAEAEERLADMEVDDETPPRRRAGRDRDRDDRRGGRRGRRPMGRPGMGRPKPLIQDIFRRGQEVLVQVIKEAIGTKGPTLTTYISIPGRYLVLMPGLKRIGVSRKIADEEQRRRLRDVLQELQPPRGLGFIIRTAGLDRNKKELQRDLAYLTRLWQVVVRRIRKLKAPAEIYQESDMITRTIRDTFTSEIDTIWVDERSAFDHAQEFMQIVMPRYASRIKCYDGTEPMFYKYGIEEEIARIQMRHVPLPNGGSIVIDQTEALVAIDVNSGNFRADNNAEETAYQINLQAGREIARQLRLRDLGGVIVNDFIDMREESHRRAVEKSLRDAVKRDRARTKILKISAFGLIEMTRQRIRPSLKRSVYQDCPCCGNTGQVKTVESMSIDVMRMLQLAAHREHIHRIQIRVQEDVANYLLNRKRREIAGLEAQGGLQVQITGVLAVSPELLEFTCYDVNNNEVKFLHYNEGPPSRR
jgi:ribonuclease E